MTVCSQLTANTNMRLIRCDSPIQTRSDRRPTALFDRDGVLNTDHGYVADLAKFEWAEGAQEAVKACVNRNFAVGIVTNQSGIGRGYYTEEQFATLMEHVAQSVPVEVALYCPHAPELNCDGRKPSPKMLEMAMRELGADRARTFFIGDKESDREAAAQAGIRYVEFSGGNLLEAIRPILDEFSSAETV